MRSTLHRSDAVALAFVVGAGLVGLVLSPRLPAEMAVHFDASGTPDNYVPRPLALLLLPAIGVGTVLFVRASARYDASADPRTLSAAVLFVGGTVAYVHLLILAWNLGYGYDIGVAITPVLALAGVLVVYALYRDGVFA